jgi:MGT family glycosyltransferase
VSRYLIASTPAQGHVTPVVAVATELVRLGHDVLFMGGRRFEREIKRSGASYMALPEACDWDDRDQDAAFPGRARRPGPLKMLFDVRTAFCDPMPHQARGIAEASAAFAPDVVVVDCLFTGVAPLLMAGPPDRPRVAVLGVIPMFLSSRDTAPFGMGIGPLPGRLGQLRNAFLNMMVQKVAFAGITRHANALLAGAGVPPLPMFLLDSAQIADRIMQLAPASFEYPRRDLPANVSFVGPVRPRIADGAELPQWWHELDGGRRVVLVTQGTLDNVDLGRVIGPTLEALADEDLLVVVTTGGRPADAVPGPIPANARIASFLPYDALMPKVDVMVSNGGYGGVLSALSHGVPVVVAGASEDKPEVAGRVAWSGTGINMRTGRPRPQALRAAVRKVLTDPSYRANATRLRADIASLDTLPLIVESLEVLAARRPVAADAPR